MRIWTTFCVIMSQQCGALVILCPLVGVLVTTFVGRSFGGSICVEIKPCPTQQNGVITTFCLLEAFELMKL